MPPKQANEMDAYVGNQVRLRRTIIGMSQEKLGQELGLTFQQLQKYEKGTNRISAGRLWKIAQILGVPISYFYPAPDDSVPSPQISPIDPLAVALAKDLARIPPKHRDAVRILVRALAQPDEGKE